MDYDFAVIGGGSAGYAAARTAVELGLRTVVIEGGETVGGLCILRGCMPSKTLLESANRAVTIRRAAEFGLRAGELEVFPAEIVARKRRLIGEFADYRREQLETGAFDFVRATAEFRDANTLALRHRDGGESTLTARTVLVATGSSIRTPPIPGLIECGPLSSDDVLELEELPGSIIVLGGGPVALELAHYLHALGVEVTIIQRSAHVLSWFDADLADVVADAYRERGMAVYTDTELTRIETEGGRKIVNFMTRDGARSVAADAVFNGLGRQPNLDGLHLDRTGVVVEQRKITIRPTMQSTTDTIFAAGDVCGPFEIVHLAVAQGETAARNAAHVIRGTGPLEKMDYRLALFGVFTDPEVAAVGMTENAARAEGRAIRAATHPFADHGKSIVMGETHGAVKLIADAATGEILGGAVVGPHATDLIHEVVVAMAFRSTAAQFAAIPHYHPTLSEIWTYPAEELAEAGA